MSNLGTVYVIKISENTKELFPVVYENKSFFYCKKKGSDYLTHFNKPGTRSPLVDTMTHDAFNDLYTSGSIQPHMMYSVYVPPHVKEYFEWLTDLSSQYGEVSRLEQELARCRKAIHKEESKIRTSTCAIDSYTVRCSQLEADIAAIRAAMASEASREEKHG